MSHKVFSLSVIVVDNVDLIIGISRYLEDESITPKLPKQIVDHVNLCKFLPKISHYC